jgi:hypothetical protein
MSRSREKVNNLKKIHRKNSIIMQNSEIVFIEIQFLWGFISKPLTKMEMQQKLAVYHL